MLSVIILTYIPFSCAEINCEAQIPSQEIGLTTHSNCLDEGQIIYQVIDQIPPLSFLLILSPVHYTLPEQVL